MSLREPVAIRSTQQQVCLHEGAEPIELAELMAQVRTSPITLPPPTHNVEGLPDIAPAPESDTLIRELGELPQWQKLFEHHQFAVYVGQATQFPTVVYEIARQRERTFRSMLEGSGQELDRDHYDDHYLHLILWDTSESCMVGGYRLGRTDELLAEHGPSGLYLNQIFEFDPSFFEQVPMLEIGRSFVVPEYQRHHLSLALLWRGIAQYLVKEPRYRRVFGAVSISRLYLPTTVALLRDALLEPESLVQARAPFVGELEQEISRWLSDAAPMPGSNLNQIARVAELDGKDMPVLVRHYQKLGAKFVAMGLDPHFNNTPAFVIRLDPADIPERQFRRYFGEGGASYLAA